MHDLVNEIVTITKSHLNSSICLRETPAAVTKQLEQGDGDDVNPQMYRQIVGKIMYLCNKIMIKGANASRELSSFFMHLKTKHWAALIHFVGFLEAKKNNIQLTYRKPKELQFIAAADANFAQDRSNRQSVSEAVYTLGGTIIG